MKLSHHLHGNHPGQVVYNVQIHFLHLHSPPPFLAFQHNEELQLDCDILLQQPFYTMFSHTVIRSFYNNIHQFEMQYEFFQHGHVRENMRLYTSQQHQNTHLH